MIRRPPRSTLFPSTTLFPISGRSSPSHPAARPRDVAEQVGRGRRLGEELAHVRLGATDRKSTRLNSSHSQISYAVFCLKKKKHSTKSFHIFLGSRSIFPTVTA